ncbi:COG4315 family predicted lipoprotein [Luteimonas terricola]|uniref:Lipoprotein with Yx(FWY)xxD motif n=1 Tax=Luteimonas terricola TaxID=645597 RepID=A0ABQ2EGG8_9GAMM|nr:hypothetical protein [Luteimonas terricola]GGK10852.1 hypothetical protein GCM10011394_20380 [Luteimonas terricola]
MNRSMTMLALGLGGAMLMSGCDHSDRRTDAGEARSQADAGADRAQADTPTLRPTGTPVPIQQGATIPGSENATLAMSGTPSSHLVDGAGSAIYVLAGNTDGSRCDAACEEVWPPVLAHDAQPTAGPGVEGARIGTLERGDRSYVTYGGQPLYRYAGDAGAERTAGAGVDDQWGKWSLVGLDGQPQPDPR